MFKKVSVAMISVVEIILDVYLTILIGTNVVRMDVDGPLDDD